MDSYITLQFLLLYPIYSIHCKQEASKFVSVCKFLLHKSFFLVERQYFILFIISLFNPFIFLNASSISFSKDCAKRTSSSSVRFLGSPLPLRSVQNRCPLDNVIKFNRKRQQKQYIYYVI